MKKKKKFITNKKERVILSDVLPFELPATFSNRNLYDFIIENDVTLKDKILSWKSDDTALDIIVQLLFGPFKSTVIKSGIYTSINLCFKELKKIPFGYKISHKKKEFRELTVIHPLNQLSVIEFYDKYKELIIYYCGISQFSLRRPFKIAKFSYYKDRTHMENFAFDHEHNTVEEFDKEYENLKTFFVYKEISNIYKFYESYRYHRCEKKFDYLFKFDVSKCFDSIYSHSISWALLNKEIVKDNVKLSNNTFGGNFDRLMQNLNYNETNGIVIGPEFSRIFAEIILQQIDKNVMDILRNNSSKLVFRRDYEIFRYVDDIFVFYNSDRCKEEILENYRLELKKYKLYINDLKSVLVGKPIITEITRAKIRISDLMNRNLKIKLKDNAEDDKNNNQKFSFYVSANRLITRFKSIIKESNITYSEIQNYSLACLNRKVVRITKSYSKMDDKKDYERMVTKAFLGILDFAFFIYSVSPKVNSTIKLCMTLSKIIRFSKKKENFSLDNRHQILKKIYDEIFLVLRKYKGSGHTQVETLYLLIALKELGREYRLDEEVMCKHYGINLKTKKCENHLNYFSIIVLLFYIENKKRYIKSKSIIKSHILSKINIVDIENRQNNTELVLLFFDLLVCPYLDRK